MGVALKVGGVTAVVAVVLVAVLVGFVLRLTAGPVRAARDFFAATAKGGPAAGYALAAPGFRSATSPERWAQYVRDTGVAGYSGARWSSRSVESGVARLDGSLIVAGGVAPATVRLVRGADGWRVLHVEIVQGGVSLAPPPGTSGPAASPGASRRVAAQQVAALCKAALARQTAARFDAVVCASDLPVTVGSTATCQASSAQRSTRYGRR